MTPNHPRAVEIEAYALSPPTGATDAQVPPFSSGGQVRSALANADSTDAYKATQAADFCRCNAIENGW
jgi:hypothetical protein